jgi:RNA polymerase sigma-70 factor (ECF subfamily)
VESQAVAFLSGLPEPTRERIDDPAGLARQLQAVLDRARAAWPDLDLPADAFLAHLFERLAGDAPPALEELRAGDLYLACGCALGDRAAIEAFEAQLFPVVDAAVGRMNLPRSTIDDVKQILRRELFVAQAGEPPKIASYDGRGDLRAWLRVTSVRTALKVLRKQRREVPLEQERLLALPGHSEDAELEYMKRAYRGAFKEAFQEALASLPDRQQNLLRQQFLDGLTIDQVSALYRVHRATAARWMAAAREALLNETRARLTQRVQVSVRECDSIMRLVQSQLDITLRGLFK